MPSISHFTLGLLLVATGLAFWRGSLWERAVAIVLLLAWICSAFLPFDGVTPPWGVIALDCAVFLFLLFVCLNTRRHWPIFAAAFQFLVLATHYVFVRNQDLMQWAYVSAYYVWNIGLIIALCLGAVVGGKRAKTDSDERRE